MDFMDDIVSCPKKKRKIEVKAEFIRTKKLKGEEHINHVGKLVPAIEVGPDCKCKRHRCFVSISEESRKQILSDFLNIPSKDQQDTHLLGLIKVELIKQRRSKKRNKRTDPASTRIHVGAFYYKVALKRNNKLVEQPVCAKAFCSLHGVRRNRLRRLQTYLLNTGFHESMPKVALPKYLTKTKPKPAIDPALDKRGKHNNRPKMLPLPVKYLVAEHIKSFLPTDPLKNSPKSNKLYIAAQVPIKKMHERFLKEYYISVPYKTFWAVYKNEFDVMCKMPNDSDSSIYDILEIKLDCESDNETSASDTRITSSSINLDYNSDSDVSNKSYDDIDEIVECDTEDPLSDATLTSNFDTEQQNDTSSDISNNTNNDAVSITFNEVQIKVECESDTESTNYAQIQVKVEKDFEENLPEVQLTAAEVNIKIERNELENGQSDNCSPTQIEYWNENE